MTSSGGNLNIYLWGSTVGFSWTHFYGLRTGGGRCDAAEEPLSSGESGGGVTGHRGSEPLLAAHNEAEPGGGGSTEPVHSVAPRSGGGSGSSCRTFPGFHRPPAGRTDNGDPGRSERSPVTHSLTAADMKKNSSEKRVSSNGTGTAGFPISLLSRLTEPNRDEKKPPGFIRTFIVKEAARYFISDSASVVYNDLFVVCCVVYCFVLLC